jgi:hypothetical protein
VGKNKYIESPEKMWELFEAYRKEVKSNPRHITDFYGKDGEERIKPLERPLTLEGFENYVSDLDIISDLSNYFANSDNKYTEYSTICSRIRRTIKQDQIEGGMVGQYNPSITQRLNGLVDKKEIEQNTNINASKIILSNGTEIEL